jgi:ABC-type nitrate/sulfonate/bicarbonate transport system ATPase subunit
MHGVRIELNGLCYGYGGPAIFDKVDLEIDAGGFVSLVGDSGCGKTTLLLLMAGLLNPTLGSVKLGGKEASTGETAIGFVFQDYALFPWMTVRSNLLFGSRAKRRPDRNGLVSELLGSVGLSGCEEMYPHELSGGMRQRAGLARCLANDPSVLFLDEPFGALDSRTRQSMQLLIEKIWIEKQVTIVFVTHDLDEALLLSDRVLICRQGTTTKLEEIPVPFSRPRERSELLATAEFAKLRAVLRQATIGEND